MNKLVRISVLPVAAIAVACGRGKSTEKDGALSADLKRDLAAASASGVELASSVGDYQRTRFVSPIESPATSAPVRKRNVHKPVARPASLGEGQVAKAPDPAPDNKVEVTQPEPSTEAPAPTIDTPTTVAVTPPTPVCSPGVNLNRGRPSWSPRVSSAAGTATSPPTGSSLIRNRSLFRTVAAPERPDQSEQSR